MRRVILVGVVFACVGWAVAERPPNIVLIMADDMGYESLSVNGSESYKSPNLDRLAAEGIRFTNCFANPLCTPSRAKIMTGISNVRNYIKFGVLDRSQTTFAHQLKKAGYATAVAGKWQLGKEPDAAKHFGFDQSCLWQHWRPRSRKVEGVGDADTRFVNPRLEINGKEVDFDNGEYGPQICADFICDFIEQNKDKPFVAYYPMLLTHCPFDPTPDSTDWDPKRPGSTTYKGDKQAYQRHFTDMVAYADKIVAQIDAQLRKSGVRDNTLLIFTGDNGTDRPIRTKWKGREVVGGKGSMADEGMRVPLIMNWPNGLIDGGRVSDELVEFTDMLPTLCEVTGASLPEAYPGDGTSLLPVLRGEGARKKDLVYVWYDGKVMVRNHQYAVYRKKQKAEPVFWRYEGPFDGAPLKKLSEPEQAVRVTLLAKLKEMDATRLTAVKK